MQLRRVLLLFALVLGASAVVASIFPPRDTSDREPAGHPRGVPSATARAAPEGERVVQFRVPREPRAIPTRHLRAGAAVSLRVAVRTAGDVSVDDLGLRQTADPLTPARFDFVADVPGRHSLEFQPVDGRLRLVGRLLVTRRPGGR